MWNLRHVSECIKNDVGTKHQRVKARYIILWIHQEIGFQGRPTEITRSASRDAFFCFPFLFYFSLRIEKLPPRVKWKGHWYRVTIIDLLVYIQQRSSPVWIKKNKKKGDQKENEITLCRDGRIGLGLRTGYPVNPRPVKAHYALRVTRRTPCSERHYFAGKSGIGGPSKTFRGSIYIASPYAVKGP